MSTDDLIEAALRRRPADERAYGEPLAPLVAHDAGLQRVRPVTQSRLGAGPFSALAAVAVVLALVVGVETAGFFGPNGTASRHNDFQPTGRVGCFGDGPGYTPGPYTESSDGCPLMVVAPDGLETATWELDPSVPYSAGATEIHVLAQEWACNSGRDASGRVVQSVAYRDDAVVVTLALRPDGDTMHSCQSNPATPYVVRLDQAVGNRLLQDGGRWPAATLAQAGRPVASPGSSELNAWPTSSVPVSVTLAPDGMLPLGPTRSLNQPPSPCSPGIPGSVGGAAVYPADVVTYYQAQTSGGAGSEVVNYDWGGHRPLAADGLHVTIPDPDRALRVGRSGMRLVVATSDGVCFSGWGVTARSVQGYDGTQDPGSWDPLGAGTAAADAVVVGGLAEGDWIVHIHLAYSSDKQPGTYSSDSYIRVIVGGSQAAIPAASVPPPDPVVKCEAPSVPSGSRPAVALTTDGAPAPVSVEGVPGTVPTGYGGFDLPAGLPAHVVDMAVGDLFTIRTEDGSCATGWSLWFSPAPDSLAAPVAGGTGLAFNNGVPDNADAQAVAGAARVRAPSAGEWLVALTFGTDGATYYWRISVS